MLLLMVICLGQTIQAQTRILSGGWGYGFTTPHHSDMWNYITGHAQNFHAEYTTFNKLDSGRNSNIIKGLGFTFINPGNPDTMGYALGLFPQIQFPFNCEKKHSYFVLGCGLEYSTKTYTEENFAFNAISSHFNALIMLGYRRIFSLTPQWKLNTELRWTHFSNGSTKAPNLGLNIPTLCLGLQYRWDVSEYKPKSKTMQNNLNVGNWTFIGTGSWKQVKAEAHICGAYSLQVEKNISPKRINSWSIGSDLIVDYTMNDRLTEFSDTVVPFSNNIKLSLKGGWTVPIGRLHIVLQAGSYLKNSNFKKEFAFERLSLRYFLNENVGVDVGLRAHFAKADAIEYGVVYRLPYKRQMIINPAF